MFLLVKLQNSRTVMERKQERNERRQMIDPSYSKRSPWSVKDERKT